jgi:hypothetical protein
MKFTGGLIRDRNPIDIPPGSWADARNIILSKGDTISNEEGVNRYGDDLTGYPEELHPIGKLLLEQKKYIFSVNTAVDKSEIGYIDNEGNYFPIIRTSLFNFSEDFPLQAEGQINYIGDEVIAWIDFINPPRVLNVTNLPFELDSDLELVNPELINATLMFQESRSAVVTVTSLNDSGGNILSGSVQFAISYSNEGLSRTDMFNLTRPVPVSPSPLSRYTRFEGAEHSTRTSKSISINVTQLDTRFDNVHIHVLRRNGGELTLEEVTSLPIPESGSLNYTYTGSETVTDITLEELLVDRFRYSNAKAITQVNDRIYLGNLKTKSSVNFLEHFLKLKINYISLQVTGDNSLQGSSRAEIRDGFVVHSFPSFMPGEVYAIYASARLKDGTITPAYHIPGREKELIPDPDNPGTVWQTYEDAEIDPDNAYTLKNVFGVGINVWGSHEEDYISGARKYYQTRPTANNPFAISNQGSNMGYWENFNEVYPEGYGDLTGTPVRHHRFPESNQVNTANRNRRLRALGIEISGFDLFPEEILEQIDSVEIFYAKKDFGNSIVIAQDITQFNSKSIQGVSQEWVKYFGGPWRVQYRGTNQGDGGSDWSINETRAVADIDRSRLRSLSFDIRDLPSITPNYVTYQYKLQGPDYRELYDSATDTGGLAEKVNTWTSGFISGNNADGTGRISNLFLIGDFMLNDSVDFTISYTKEDYLSRIKGFTYIPANVNAGGINNRFSNEHLSIEIEKVPQIAPMELYLRYSSNETSRAFEIGTTFEPRQREETIVYNICQVRENLFSSFESQDLISCGEVLKLEGNSYFNVYGGDCNVSSNTAMHFSEVPTFRWNGGDIQLIPEYYRLEDAPSRNGIKVARRFLGYFRSNPAFRHRRPGDVNSEFLGPSNIPQFHNEFRRDLPETFAYNDDYSFRNEVINVSPHKEIKREATVFPTRIIRSIFQPRELLEIQWNRFLPGDYYEHQKNRGEITNLEADNDRLIIHCRYGLFVTRASDRLGGNETDITISSGDLFELPPREIISSDTGYAGLHSPFSAKRCKLGYVFADHQQGKIFIVNDSIDEISNKGLRNFFAEELVLSSETDRPYRDLGIIFEFDERFNRLLMTKKDPAGKNFTLSYDPSGKWISFHDYIPDMYIADRKNFYSIEQNRLYIHNSPVREFYGVPFVSRIDFTFSQPVPQTKLLASVKWVSEVKNGDLNQQRRTFNKIMVYNSYQCSGEIVLTERNLAYVENEWRFNKFMDIVNNRNLPFLEDYELIDANINPNLPYFKQRKFIDKYFVIRMFYNNTLSKDIYLYDIEAMARESAN